ncbi:MAG: hypothetical protein RI885_2490 [Actinomycetota bacterium]
MRRERVWPWVLRYLPNEILGTLTAVASGWWMFALTSSEAVGAISATVGEGVGFYGAAAVRAWIESRSAATSAATSASTLSATSAETSSGHTGARMLSTLRSLILEFGPAEVIDTLAARPALMYLAAVLLAGAPSSWLVGKVAADIVFYAIVIASVVLRRRGHATHPPPPCAGARPQTVRAESTLPRA